MQDAKAVGLTGCRMLGDILHGRLQSRSWHVRSGASG